MLRSGEVEVATAGGKCSVCNEIIELRKAVQLFRWTSCIRHIACMPKTDTRQGVKPLSKKVPYGCYLNDPKKVVILGALPNKEAT